MVAVMVEIHLQSITIIGYESISRLHRQNHSAWNIDVLRLFVMHSFILVLFFFSNICPLHHVHQKPPLGLCVVTMTLPKDWFKSDQTVQQHQSKRARQRHPYRLWSLIKSKGKF